MYVVTGRMAIRNGHEDEFIAAAKAAVAASNGNEEGCLEYTCSRDLDDPSVFVFVEQWPDGAALRAHVASEHYAQFRAAVDPIVESTVANIHTVEKTRTV
jgi:quinol monooxygenase YgiN